MTTGAKERLAQAENMMATGLAVVCVEARHMQAALRSRARKPHLVAHVCWFSEKYVQSAVPCVVPADLQSGIKAQAVYK